MERCWPPPRSPLQAQPKADLHPRKLKLPNKEITMSWTSLIQSKKDNRQGSTHRRTGNISPHFQDPLWTLILIATARTQLISSSSKLRIRLPKCRMANHRYTSLKFLRNRQVSSRLNKPPCHNPILLEISWLHKPHNKLATAHFRLTCRNNQLDSYNNRKLPVLISHRLLDLLRGPNKVACCNPKQQLTIHLGRVC